MQGDADRPSTSKRGVAQGPVTNKRTEEDEEEDLTVVKQGLRSSLNLTEGQWRVFSRHVEAYVEAISKMYRRAGLTLHLALLRMATSSPDAALPDLFDRDLHKTTFWKHLLTRGPEADGVLSSVQDVYALLESVDLGGINGTISDQLVAYASTALKTAVCNNMWVPLIPRLTRLCRLKVKLQSAEEGGAGISAYKLLGAVRNSESHAAVGDLPGWALSFRKEVRSRLAVPDTAYISDKYVKKGKPFDIVYRFYLWMHGLFVANDFKGVQLSPIFRVRRAFVRLDEKILAHMACDVFSLPASEKRGLSSDGAARKALVRRLFAPSALKNGPKSFSCSMMTDGVVANLQYVTLKKKLKTSSTSKAKTIKKRTSVTYPRRLSTMYTANDGGGATPSRLVVGLDPGRTNLATMSYALDEVERKTWTLTRGTYYTASGIWHQNRLQQKRFRSMETHWSELGSVEENTDGRRALKTNDPNSVLLYLQHYSLHRDEWWSLALKRVESRANFQRYIGKRRVLDGFFSGVREELTSRFPGVPLEVAYGQAYVSMKSSGPGELAVPTTGTYHACVRSFRGFGHDVEVVDEHLTSQIDWESGSRFDRVFMRTTKNELLHFPYAQATHTCLPPEADQVRSLRARLKLENTYRRQWRRPGGELSDEAENGGLAGCAGQRRPAYPEVRGLRFVPETRKYLNRDKASALAIARLRVLELSGHARPRVYSRVT